MDRMHIYGAFHNWWKPYRIKSGKKTVHGEVAGVSRQSIEKEKRYFFTKRYFVSKLRLSSSQWMSWYRLWHTPKIQDLVSIARFAE
jgi:hypothetical protein